MFVIKCKGTLLRAVMMGSPISVFVSDLGPEAKAGESKRGADVELELLMSILCASMC